MCCVIVYLKCPGVDEVLGTVDTVELSQAGLVVVNLDMDKIQLEGGGSQEEQQEMSRRTGGGILRWTKRFFFRRLKKMTKKGKLPKKGL